MKYQIGDYVVIRNKVRDITNISLSFSFKGISYIYHNGSHTLSCKNPKPILLNDDLFEHLEWSTPGFENKGQYQISGKLDKRGYNITILKNRQLVAILSNIKYLHELQQVFRTLTQKELINEKYDKALSSYKPSGDS
jgi:hypothetical protein